MLLLLVKCMYAMPIIDTRIIGGDDIHIKEYPATVSLNVYQTAHICGGTLIGSHWVVTAAHCINPENSPDFYSINLNSTFIGDDALVDYTVKQYVIHPEYDETKITSDIAILELDRDVTSLAKKAILSTTQPTVGIDVHTVGWGVIAYDGENNGYLSAKLQYTNGVVTSPLNCQIHEDRPGIVCMDPREDSTTCNGDSGTGLYNNDEALIGVTSFGYNLFDQCSHYYPSGFARIDYFIDFICSNTDSSVQYTNGSCTDPPPKNTEPVPQVIIIGTIVGVIVLGAILSFIVGYCVRRRSCNLDA
ncbi:hypothetical protein EPVG_00442 [Emiliania huxleyi virus 201]|nr:hypothetical protein EQVG_00389 [Emiliania huxleyi virus 207]AEP16199.1 hypothetical protein ERVG_00324 [Emiliania huxleyi virus 208]AET98329.1 hypothetical protein EPVG_00442 [Emiliania huxleyi virus 201]